MTRDAYWIEYRKQAEASIAQRRADAEAGIKRCKEPGCMEPVAQQRRPNRKYGADASRTTSAQSYCVIHAAADEGRRRVRQEKDRQRARKRAEKEKLAQGAQRAGA